MRAFAVFLLVGTAACAQLFGIDKTTAGGGDDDGSNDAGLPGSSLEIERYSIGASIVEAPLPVAGLELPTFFVGSAGVPGVAGSDAWSTDQVSSSVLFFLPDVPVSIPREFTLASPNIKTLFGVLERPGATPPPPGATVDVELTLTTPVAAGDGVEVFDIGAWSALGFPVAVGQAAIALPGTLYSTFASENGAPLSSIGATDAILGLHYAGNQLIEEVDLPGFDQTGSDTITGTLVPLTQSLALNANVSPDTGTTRLATALPLSPNPPAVVWSLVAAPGYLIASGSGPQLDALVEPTTTLNVTASYANPFATSRGWHTVFTWVIHSDRTYTPAAGTLAGQVIGLTAQLDTIREPGNGANPDAATLDAGMPMMVTLGATPLTTDGIVLADDPTTPLVVSFTADTAANTLYQVQVLETTLSGTTQVLTDDFAYSGIAPTVTLPPNTLVAGHTYRIRAVCVAGGFPTLATGDLTNRELPLSQGVLDSGVFSVGAPL